MVIFLTLLGSFKYKFFSKKLSQFSAVISASSYSLARLSFCDKIKLFTSVLCEAPIGENTSQSFVVLISCTLSLSIKRRKLSKEHIFYGNVQKAKTKIDDADRILETCYKLLGQKVLCFVLFFIQNKILFICNKIWYISFPRKKRIWIFWWKFCGLQNKFEMFLDRVWKLW